MGKVVRCDSCQKLVDFDGGAGSREVNSWGTCDGCGAFIGLDPSSTYYKCECGYGIGFRQSAIGEGIWVKCQSCGVEYSIVPPSILKEFYSCNKCTEKSVFSRNVGTFTCDCGQTSTVPIQQAKSGKDFQCPSCKMIWSDTAALFRLYCGCGLLDSSSKLQNRHRFSTPGKVGLSQSQINSSPSTSQGKSAPSRVDKWLDRAFKAGDPISMVANFVVETAEIGAEAFKDSRGRKSETNNAAFESINAEVVARAGASVNGEAWRELDRRLGINSVEFVITQATATMVTGPMSEKVPAFENLSVVKFFKLDENIGKSLPIWWVLGAFADPVVGPVPVIFLIEKLSTSNQSRVCAIVWSSAKNQDKEVFLKFVSDWKIDGQEAVRLPGISIAISNRQPNKGLHFSPIYSMEKIVMTLKKSIEHNGVADIYMKTAPQWPYTIDYAGMSPFDIGLAGQAIRWQ